MSTDEEHPAATVLPCEAAGEEAGDAGAELAAAPPDGGPLAPPEAGFPLTGPHAASAPVASNMAAPSR